MTVVHLAYLMEVRKESGSVVPSAVSLVERSAALKDETSEGNLDSWRAALWAASMEPGWAEMSADPKVVYSAASLVQHLADSKAARSVGQKAATKAEQRVVS